MGIYSWFPETLLYLGGDLFKGEKLKKVSLFDVYTGDKLPNGHKQYALSFILQDNEKTLTDKQIEAIMSKLLKTFEQKLEAKLR